MDKLSKPAQNNLGGFLEPCILISVVSPLKIKNQQKAQSSLGFLLDQKVTGRINYIFSITSIPNNSNPCSIVFATK